MKFAKGAAMKLKSIFALSETILTNSEKIAVYDFYVVKAVGGDAKEASQQGKKLKDYGWSGSKEVGALKKVF
jgi:hypothetical protein